MALVSPSPYLSAKIEASDEISFAIASAIAPEAASSVVSIAIVKRVCEDHAPFIPFVTHTICPLLAQDKAWALLLELGALATALPTEAVLSTQGPYSPSTSTLAQARWLSHNQHKHISAKWFFPSSQDPERAFGSKDVMPTTVDDLVSFFSDPRWKTVPEPVKLLSHLVSNCSSKLLGEFLDQEIASDVKPLKILLEHLKLEHLSNLFKIVTTDNKPFIIMLAQHSEPTLSVLLKKFNGSQVETWLKFSGDKKINNRINMYRISVANLWAQFHATSLYNLLENLTLRQLESVLRSSISGSKHATLKILARFNGPTLKTILTHFNHDKIRDFLDLNQRSLSHSVITALAEYGGHTLPEILQAFEPSEIVIILKGTNYTDTTVLLDTLAMKNFPALASILNRLEPAVVASLLVVKIRYSENTVAHWISYRGSPALANILQRLENTQVETILMSTSRARLSANGTSSLMSYLIEDNLPDLVAIFQRLKPDRIQRLCIGDIQFYPRLASRLTKQQDTAIIDLLGTLPFDYVQKILMVKNTAGQTLLLLAAIANNPPVVEALIHRFKADPHEAARGLTLSQTPPLLQKYTRGWTLQTNKKSDGDRTMSLFGTILVCLKRTTRRKLLRRLPPYIVIGKLLPATANLLSAKLGPGADPLNDKIQGYKK